MCCRQNNGHVIKRSDLRRIAAKCCWGICKRWLMCDRSNFCWLHSWWNSRVHSFTDFTLLRLQISTASFQALVFCHSKYVTRTHCLLLVIELRLIAILFRLIWIKHVPILISQSSKNVNGSCMTYITFSMLITKGMLQALSVNHLVS